MDCTYRRLNRGVLQPPARSAGTTVAHTPTLRGGDLLLETVIAKRKVAVRRVPDLVDQPGIQLIP